jgi:hypothetical protein
MRPWQKFNAGAPNQLAIADRLRALGRVVVEMPVRLGPILIFVVHELEQVLRHAHMAEATARLGREILYISRVFHNWLYQFIALSYGLKSIGITI